MIPLSLGQIIVIYVIGAVIAVFFVSLASHLMRIRTERRARQRQIQCAFCGVIYESRDATEALPPCPGCSKPNERTAPLGV